MEIADIVIVGAGAAGLMAAVGAGSCAEAGASVGTKTDAEASVQAGSYSGAGASVRAAAGSGTKASAGARRVVVLEKMPRPGRKIMVTGKGRCNFTNVKDWEDFSQHIHPKANPLRPSFYNLPPQKVIEMMEGLGVECVVERGDRAFPASHQAADIVDALVKAAKRAGAEILCNKTVVSIRPDAIATGAAEKCGGIDGRHGAAEGAAGELAGTDAAEERGFRVLCQDGSEYCCKKLIITTGGLSYPTTGSTGDGLNWAAGLGIEVRPTFPSLTAIVPKNYKITGPDDGKSPAGCSPQGTTEGRSTAGTPEMKGHIDRSTPLSETGKTLMGCSLKNVGLSLTIDGNTVQEEFGDIDFTDGGIEGPIGFKVSRRCVSAIINGSKVSVTLDLKPAVEAASLEMRIASLWKEISDGDSSGRGSFRNNDFRAGRGTNFRNGGSNARNGNNSRSSGSRSYSGRFRILLRKLLPQELIPGFIRCNPDVDHKRLAKALKNWKFDIAGFVGYERCVITAGGVSASEITPKTLASKKVPGLYFAGEILDIDGDTGGYNLQAAFSTGYLAGLSAAHNIQ